ncbi:MULTISPECIES: NCS2 family permease [Bacillaceae]|uniref:Guanine/hypoxanthine permease PbuG n=1 Tax=Caldibacillus thermoamylovorans TaxID=35841 RepID=A0A090IS18_9BACI|nr:MULTISPECIES: NCS2 family permease [Bacillaceae]MCM3798722.1 NCS2 family permease [Caldibacillus thermoamylovorans]MED4850404.1 NCS2 family permease [Caldifermentibacillus hisashii]CEE00457.1 Guanine/hypoxanthine permease PbuG [Caldibacillus thermoamylovorans]
MKNYFEFDKLGTNFRTEFIAGLTTFLAMAYILFVNPHTLSATGMDQGALFTATALAAAIGSFVMGIVAKYPVALAPGMGLNAFFAYTVVLGYGIPWETALSGVLVSGVVLVILTMTGIREMIINAIPESLKYAVSAGIGLFIAFVGLINAGFVVNNDATLVGIGDLTSPTVLLAIFGLLISSILLTIGIKAGIFYGMIITSIVGMIFGLVPHPTGLNDIIGPVPSLEPAFGQALFHLQDIFSIQMLVVILTFMFVDFFDTAGTLMAVATQAGIMENGKLPRAGRALTADSSGTVFGAILGTSSTTSYVESTAGVAVGGKSGLTAVVTAVFFLLALVFSPLLEIVTSQVTAPALIIVGVLMASNLKFVEWDQIEIAIPAFFTVLMMPLTYSIATGIAVGFIFYPITMLVKGRVKEIHPIMYILAVIFILYFTFLS